VKSPRRISRVPRRVPTIIEAMETIFEPWFRGPSWDGWKVVLRPIFGVPLDETETAFFQSVAGDRLAPTSSIREFWAIVGRRGGKDSIVSLICAYMAATFDPKGLLRPGERAVVCCIAPDKDTAKIVQRYPHATAATRNRQAIVPMQAVINHAADSELCARIRVKRFRVETKSKIPATLEWIEAFRRACKRPQLGALALFMFLTGARVSEALAVEWQDVDFKSKTVLIKQTKLGNERRAHLPQSLIVVLANLPRSNSGRGVFWYETRNNCLMAWRRAAKRARIAPLSMHSCRHGFATALLQRGVDPVTVAKLGGWKSVRHVFETYGHANDDTTLTDLISGTDLTQPTKPNARKPYKTGTSRT
jgi:integrase